MASEKSFTPILDATHQTVRTFKKLEFIKPKIQKASSPKLMNTLDI
ncbi:hypothetical protein Cs308_0082 [Candidatus Chlamydia sanziniae]|uniref:Uncharacterized protein n=1 Tax=Candidatus Chlamydia sanziniae TaxID=1806891 RepID=A0A1A9HVX2_9CHLA|nr:hypothetical protein Cs308_0082 [Candidatus Chlamydia sanziniae]